MDVETSRKLLYVWNMNISGIDGDMNKDDDEDDDDANRDNKLYMYV